MEGFGEVAELHNVDNAGKVADLAEVAEPRNADNVGKVTDLAEVAAPRNADNAGKFGKPGGLCGPHELGKPDEPDGPEIAPNYRQSPKKVVARRLPGYRDWVKTYFRNPRKSRLKFLFLCGLYTIPWKLSK